jgi:hypothetical protein
VTLDLILAVQARHYIVSTNGAIFGRPDEEAKARVILKGGSQRKLWFNYVNEHTSRWIDPMMQKRCGYSVGVPSPGKTQLIIELQAAASKRER